MIVWWTSAPHRAARWVVLALEDNMVAALFRRRDGAMQDGIDDTRD